MAEQNDETLKMRGNKEDKGNECWPFPKLVDGCLTLLKNSTCKQVTNFIWFIFTLITCQYVPHKLKDKKHEFVCTLYTVFFILLFGFIVNIWPTVMIIIDWTTCPVQYFDVCYTILSYNDTRPTAKVDIPNILLSTINNPSNNISNINTANELKRFIEYEKLVLLFSAVSGTISYLIFIYCVLLRLYIRNVCRNEEANGHQSTAGTTGATEATTGTTGATEATTGTTGATEATTEATPEVTPLHPFDDSEIQTDGENGGNTSTSTQLGEKESITFWLFLLFSIVLLIAMCIVFIIHYFKRHPLSQQEDNTHIIYRYNVTNIQGFEIATAVAYFCSLFCTISSCFIFSKVMYGIQNQCKNLFKGKKTILKFMEEDEKFIEVANKTQGPFEMWFFIHWVMYIITSFLSLSFLFEAINNKIQASLVTIPPDSGIAFHNTEFILIALLAASNSFFFLYPCLRAAGVTESRKTLIRDVNDSIDFKDDVKSKSDNDKRRAFVNYLKEKNYGFRLNILCAHVKFNLNIAYISIFIGLLGVLIKVGSSI